PWPASHAPVPGMQSRSRRFLIDPYASLLLPLARGILCRRKAMAYSRLCPTCEQPVPSGAVFCPRCGQAHDPTAAAPAAATKFRRRRDPALIRGSWLLLLIVIVAVGLLPSLVDLSSLLVRAGPDQPALDRSRRAETLFRAELPRADLTPASVERR